MQYFIVSVHVLSLVLFMLSQLWLTWGTSVKYLTLRTAEKGQQESHCSLLYSCRGLFFLPLFYSAEVGRNLSAPLSVMRAVFLSYQLTLWPVAFSPSYESFLAVTQALLQPCQWHFCSSYLQGISDEFKGEMWTEKRILSWLMKLWELKWMWSLWRKNFHWPRIKKSRLWHFACVDAKENWWR